MWGELAGRLGATDINATLEKIGNAVAPREDDEDYYDGEDVSNGSYVDDEDVDDEDCSPGDREGIINKVAGASPFRLAGILTRALDDRNSKIEISDEADFNSHSIPNEILSRESVGDINDRGNDGHEENGEHANYSLQRTSNKILPGSNQLPNIYFHQGYGNHEVNLVEPANQSIENLSNSVGNLYRVEDLLPKFQKPKEEGTEITSKAASSTTMANEMQVGHFKTNETPTSNKSLKGSDKADTQKDKSTSRHPLELKESHEITPEPYRKVDIPTIAAQEQNEIDHEKEKGVFQNDDTKAACDLPRTCTTNLKGAVADNGKFLQKVVEKSASFKNAKDDITKATQLSAKEKVPLIFHTKLEEAVLNKPEDMVQSDNSIGNIDCLLKSPSRQLREPARNEIHADQPNEFRDLKQKTLEADSDFSNIQNELEATKEEIKALQSKILRDQEKVKSEKEDLIAQFHSKETRLLQATSEENQNQTELLQQEHSAKIQSLEHLLVQERKQSKEEHEEYKRLLRESYSNIEQMDNKLRTTVKNYENQMGQLQQQEERALRKVDDRMAQTMAVLDERDEEIKCLKKSIREMESKVNEHQEGEEEAEEELEEIHQENDSLRQTIEKLENEGKKLKEQVSTLKSGSEELSALQMELTMLKEELNRERSKNQAVMDSAMTSHSQIEVDRDNALSELKDSKQKLGATLGDLEIARTDYSRLVMANENLQAALEAFQDERQAEIDMINEQRHESEEALKSAHATATSALKQIHETEMYEVQKASDDAVKNVMREMEFVENNLKKLKSENKQMRRSLDEAIHMLQTSQEDVIDRIVMKNILLDWCTLNDKSKRQQVLQVMANLLHFSEEEKEKVHVTAKSLDSVRTKVVEALAAPLPPSKADVEHLEGSNVHEKWVNFLMAETDDV